MNLMFGVKGMSSVKKKVSIFTATHGMILADDVLTETGRLIIGKGTQLTESVLNNLRTRNVSSVTIEIEHVESLPEHFRTDKCEKHYADAFLLIETAFVTMRLNKELPLAEMREMAVKAVLAITETVGALQYLQSMRRPGEYTFHHSVNVGVLCGILGKWLGYESEGLAELVLTGLLHDIGKSQVPLYLINKPNSLTAAEMDQMKEHSAMGEMLMKKAGSPSLSLVKGVLQHHERMDGSGYPHGTQGKEIHPYARIVAVADTFDAVTSDRPYHAKESPFTAARVIAQEMFGKLDMEIASTFLERIRDYFIGAQVYLNDGRSAEVIMLGTDFTFKPVIRTHACQVISLDKL